MASPRPLVVALAAVLLVACGGGGGGGGTVQPSRCISLSVDAAPAPGSVVLAKGPGSTCSRLVVDVVVTGVTDVFAANLTIQTSERVVRYGGASAEGSFLASGGVQVQVEDAFEGGAVFVGLTRLATDGVTVTDPRTLVRLFFTPGDVGGATMSLDAGLFGSETPPRRKDGIASHGGFVEVR